MAKISEIHVFNPATLSEQQKARLESLLCNLEAAVKDRRQFLSEGGAKAMKEYLKNPAANEFDHDYLALFNIVPEDRWPAIIEELKKEVADVPGTVDDLARLKTLDLAQQKKAVAYIASQYTRFLDKPKERAHWKKVDRLYQTILSEFPDILSNKDDVLHAVTLGLILKEKKNTLKEAWENASAYEKIDLTKSLLKQAYPQDDVDHVHAAMVKIEQVAAAFHRNLTVDTIACGPLFTKMEKYGFPLYLFAHEFQHRRQARLVDRLERGLVSKDSAEYYPARLFQANFKGGSLSPSTEQGKIAMMAKFTDYCEQPIEAQANMMASIASNIGETGGDTIWSIAETFSKAASAVARPVDTVMKGIDWIIPAKLRKPEGP